MLSMTTQRRKENKFSTVMKLSSKILKYFSSFVMFDNWWQSGSCLDNTDNKKKA